jgi:cation diffusion facilitator CzcD-associated flavoprotein CzcO
MRPSVKGVARRKVLIVGAGMAGLAAARAIQKVLRG